MPPDPPCPTPHEPSPDAHPPGAGTFPEPGFGALPPGAGVRLMLTRAVSCGVAGGRAQFGPQGIG